MNAIYCSDMVKMFLGQVVLYTKIKNNYSVETFYYFKIIKNSVKSGLEVNTIIFVGYVFTTVQLVNIVVQ